MDIRRYFIPIKDYRKYYIRLLELSCFQLPKNLIDYEVHHIDGNRKNNEYTNLCLIPKKLHNEYHNLPYSLYFMDLNYESLLSEISSCEKHKHSKDSDLADFANRYLSFAYKDIVIHEKHFQLGEDIRIITKEQHESIQSLLNKYKTI